ncbi:hypothetical protein BN381_20012 [Candidatus Microthrix parvicella RN1]|uniref:Uncharacterized protein n=1 Tax=Candidatus Neomicrothrix parvicella RN1 TaxID=1229780 RepID=R4YXY1_9ACTN|nr:hypothetical protein BN381_20012 [Candidatus Microthrix parvicella RN1]
MLSNILRRTHESSLYQLSRKAAAALLANRGELPVRTGTIVPSSGRAAGSAAPWHRRRRDPARGAHRQSDGHRPGPAPDHRRLPPASPQR